MGAVTLLLAAAFVFQAMGSRWNRRHSRPNWKQRELAAQAPRGEDQRRVRPYLRSSETAPDPELARLTVATAREHLRVWENPWQHYGYSVFIAAMVLNIFTMTALGNVSAGVLYVFLPLIAAMAVYYPLKRRRVLPRARRAVEANEELAARAPAPPDDGRDGWDGWDQLRKPY
ncbi:hypothetical protein NE857_31795 [Nocardiopsis exhalans]|uniref:Uncharacterized protein n=1 Tax=Nocardiopsis exhalans TaxID=163604 RepID=A0ABY5D9V5_9ACTN|nr:hypothetical protein [Nocardiopsis exhalans]USY19760.1 hypothetical protein NE857_31795 [Nocardiopsis exhalans]